MIDLGLAVRSLRSALFEGIDHTDAFNAVIDGGVTASVDAKDAAIRALLADLDGAHQKIVGELAVASGALVEQGGSPIEAINVLVAALADGANTLVAAGPALYTANLDAGQAPDALAPRERAWVR